MGKIGFIGGGNMATAMMSGMIRQNIIDPKSILVSDCNPDALKRLQDTLGVMAAVDNLETVKKSQVLVLAVKPQYYEEVISEIRDEVSPEQIIVTIAPGWSMERIKKAFGKPVKLIRTMPNTPALIGEGVTAICPDMSIKAEELEEMITMFHSFGKTEIIDEPLMDAVIAVSGSSPAYVFMMIEAMADGAVAAGMPRKQAYRFAAAAVFGSAKMVLETGQHPGELKDMVCSPAGTTIEAVRVLEEKGFRSSLIEAMDACIRKTRKMEK